MLRCKAQKKEKLSGARFKCTASCQQSKRADEKLQHLRKQAAAKNEEAGQAIDDLHKEIIEADSLRVQIRQRAERADSACVQAEREADAEKVLLEQEKKDMVESYQRLEKVVVNHLRNLRSAVTEASDPLNESSVAFV